MSSKQTILDLELFTQALRHMDEEDLLCLNRRPAAYIVRTEIAASREPACVPAECFRISDTGSLQPEKCEVFGDRSYMAHDLEAMLTPAQERQGVHQRHTFSPPRWTDGADTRVPHVRPGR